MTPDEFKAWRKEMGFTQKEAATALGITNWAIENYERGTRRDDGRPVVIPRAVALACKAIFYGLEPWQPDLPERRSVRRKS